MTEIKNENGTKMELDNGTDDVDIIKGISSFTMKSGAFTQSTLLSTDNPSFSFICLLL